MCYNALKKREEKKVSSESSNVGGSGSQTVSYQYGGCTYFGAPPVYQGGCPRVS